MNTNWDSIPSLFSRPTWWQAILCCALLALAAGCHFSSQNAKSPPPLEQTANPVAPAPQPLALSGTVSEAEPLLLEDSPGDEETITGADNRRCQVCHINFMSEELTRVHAKADIGCAQCHGESDAHIADESWASGGNGTAPDVMFPKSKINPFCLECHPRDKIDADAHQEFFADRGGQAVCVDCHGQHRMALRKCKWK